MTITYQIYCGRLTIGSNNDDLTVDTTAKALTAGDYYPFQYSGESDDQLIEHLQDKIDDVVASSTVAYDDSSGKITITWGSGSHTLTWDNTDLRDALGFTTNLSGAGPFVADNEPQHIWRPDRGLASYPNQLNNVWEPVSTTVAGRSKDGTTYSVAGNLLYRADLAYQMLDDAVVITPSSAGSSTDFQAWFERVPHEGQPLRFYPDRTLNASTSYVTALFAEGREDEPVGEWSRFATRHLENLNTLWDVAFQLIKVVE